MYSAYAATNFLKERNLRQLQAKYKYVFYFFFPVPHAHFLATELCVATGIVRAAQ
jgi:hypothetical protein